MSQPLTTEKPDDIIADVPGGPRLTATDAARRVAASRSPRSHNKKRETSSAVTPGNAVRSNKGSKLHRAKGDRARTEVTTTPTPPGDPQAGRFVKLTRVLRLSIAQVKLLKTQVAASKAKEAEQRREIDSLRAQQATDLPGVNSRPQETPRKKRYYKRRRSKAQKLVDRSLKVIGVAGLIIATTGIVIAVVYAINNISRGIG